MTLKTFQSHSAGALADPEPPVRVNKILVAVDFSPCSKNAFRHAVALANHFRAGLTVLNVVPSAGSAVAAVHRVPMTLEDDLINAEENLHALIDSGPVDQDHPPKPILRLGLPAHEICEAANDLNADLIVVGTHGNTGWKHFCIGSTAERVVRAARCPVFVVREKEHDFSTDGVIPC